MLKLSLKKGKGKAARRCHVSCVTLRSPNSLATIVSMVAKGQHLMAVYDNFVNLLLGDLLLLIVVVVKAGAGAV